MYNVLAILTKTNLHSYRSKLETFQLYFLVYFLIQPRLNLVFNKMKELVFNFATSPLRRK